MAEEILGEYPFRIEDRFDELVVHFQSKLNPLGGTVFNLRFKVKDIQKRNRIKEIINDLSKIDS